MAEIYSIRPDESTQAMREARELADAMADMGVYHTKNMHECCMLFPEAFAPQMDRLKFMHRMIGAMIMEINDD